VGGGEKSVVAVFIHLTRREAGQSSRYINQATSGDREKRWVPQVVTEKQKRSTKHRPKQQNGRGSERRGVAKGVGKRW